MPSYAGPAEVFHNASVDGVAATLNTNGTVAVTGTSVYRSVKTDIRSLPDASYITAWTGTPTGTIIVQVSNKDAPSDLTDTGWNTLTLATATTSPAGSASGDTIDLAACPFRWVRLKYTNASGTGTLAADINAKGA